MAVSVDQLSSARTIAAEHDFELADAVDARAGRPPCS